MATKLVNATQLDSDLTTVANAIRTKGGTSASLSFPSGMAQAISDIQTGITPTGTTSITENGTYDVTNYASAEVNVQGGGASASFQSTAFSPTNGAYYILHDGKRFVGFKFGNNNIGIYSTDGVNWTQYNTSNITSGICDYGTGVYVCSYYGSSNIVYSSTNGIDFNTITLGYNLYWQALKYCGGKFILLSAGNNGEWSYNGTDWYGFAMSGPANYSSVDFGNGKYVAVSSGSTPYFSYSNDANTWTQGTLPGTASGAIIAYGSGVFVIVQYGSNVAFYSTDGINFTSITLPESLNYRSIKYGNGIFIATAVNSNKAVYSKDGINWNSITLPSTAYWFDLSYGNGKFVSLGATGQAIYCDARVSIS